MTFGTVSHSLHRSRRGAFSNFFSKSSVRRLQPVIQILVDKLCKQLEVNLAIGKAVNMVHAYSALTQDVITEYCFSDCRNVLEMQDFSPWYYDLVQKPAELSHMYVQPHRPSSSYFRSVTDSTIESSNFLSCYLFWIFCLTGGYALRARCSHNSALSKPNTLLRYSKFFPTTQILVPRDTQPSSIPYGMILIYRSRKSLSPALSWKRRAL